MSTLSTGFTPAKPTNKYRNIWFIVEWLLLCIWAIDAALVMMHKHAAFFTDHAADLALPAWLYVSFRRHRNTTATSWRRILTSLPPISLAAVFFLASTGTEVSQYFWPHGIFPGTFDAIDIAAYGIGLAICCLADIRWQIPSSI